MKQCAIASLRLPDGVVVLQRRTDDAPANAGLLGHFGGRVETGETFDEAIRRELSEETSLPVESLVFKPFEVFVIDRDGTQIECHPYDIAIDSADFEVYEGVGAEVYDPGEALKRDDLTLSARHILERIVRGDYVSAD